MSVEDKHPAYLEYAQEWYKCRDCYKGQDKIKLAGSKYLPMTAGQILNGAGKGLATTVGQVSYDNYKSRAVFPDFMKEAVTTFLGVLWSKPPVIELPSRLEAMLADATAQGESLPQLLRRINEEQLLTGRLGLLLDFPSTPQSSETTPYITMYNAESVINWDDGISDGLSPDNLNLVVLDESGYVRQNDLSWDWKKRHRVLVLGDLLENENSSSVYKYGVFSEESNFNEKDLETISIGGSIPNSIPFVFVNSSDITPIPDSPLLSGLANLSLAVYKGEADYRQSLFLQGQDTLVTIGAGEEATGGGITVGAGAAINLPLGADAKFIGVDSAGLSEQRLSLENDRMKAGTMAGQVVNPSSKEKESGEALGIKIGSQTANLTQVALAGAAGLENILKKAAEWFNVNPDEVSVTPNLDFVNREVKAKELIEFMTARSLGVPLSKQSIHKILKSRGMTEKDYEEEIEEIETEKPEDFGNDSK